MGGPVVRRLRAAERVRAAISESIARYLKINRAGG